MLATIKAEIRKLLTVRSTYILLAIALAFVALTTFYVEGFWGQSGSPAGELAPSALRDIVGQSAGIVALFISIIAILQMGHEYRYNTIMHTLTANPRRTQVFFAKALVLGVFGIAVGLFTVAFGVAAYYIGLAIRGASLPPQDIEWLVMLLRVAVYSFVYSAIGFLLATLLRSVIAAIVVVLIIPMMVEPLLSLLLKDNAAYLPFSAFDHILGVSFFQGGMNPSTAIGVSVLYIGVLGAITWFAFLKRDAN